MRPDARIAAAALLPVFLIACASQPVSTVAVPATPAPIAAAIDFHGVEAERFLATARIVTVREIGQGVTRPRRVTLERDGVTHDAAFKWIDETRQGITAFADGSLDTDFWDSWQTEVAAYRIDRLIGLGMVPATVERAVRGQAGSLMWWADSAMSEQQRVERAIRAPDLDAWDRQTLKIWLFDELIANVDRHMNNLLITEDFEVRLIDHSRAFRVSRELKAPARLTRFSGALLEGLEALTFDRLKQEVGRYLSDARIARLLDRRDAILELARNLIATRGAAAVVYD